MAYNKDQVQALGAKIVDMVNAVADGVDVSDVSVGMDLLAAFMSASDEIATDKDAAVLDIVAGATSAFADQRRNPEVPA
ncbi:hypothetical protein DRQ50_00145 [bacterium]|nr:MAG: hypothetical protein DRQ50_00145 [bacterium]RKZ72436.1 MAG: hypothetical protein DRQ48_00055 [Gammaproteobacteria bacterium]